MLASEAKGKLKVGMRIKRIFDSSNWCMVKMLNDNNYYECIEEGHGWKVGDRGNINWDKGTIEILDENNKPNIKDMSFIDSMRKLGNSEVDNFLIDSGLEDPKGIPTAEGLKAMTEIIYMENREKLVAKAKEILEKKKAEEKK